MSPYPYINPAVPLPAVIVRDYVTLEELEAIEREHRADGVSIVAAAPDEWHLTVRDARGVQRTHRARRSGGGAA